MRLVADWTLVDGRLHRRAALLLDAEGVVRGVSRATPGERPPEALRHAVVVPGGTDACALTGLLGADAPASSNPIDALHALAPLACTDDLGDLRRRAHALFAAAVRAGVTTVALPHLSPQPYGRAYASPPDPTREAKDDGRPRFAVAAALAGAADEVGIRLTLLDAMVLRDAEAVPEGEAAAAWHRCGHAGLEAAVQHLDALVRYLLARRTARLSWGVLVPRPALLGADAFLGLRLRLGHLPTVVVDATERFAKDQRTARVPGVDAATLAAQCLGGGGLDACCSWLSLGPGRVDEAASAAFARAGVATLGPPLASAADFAQRGAGPAPAAATDHGTASAHGGGYAASAWLAALMRSGAVGQAEPSGRATAAGGLPAARTAANALGLRGGTLQPDTWADYAVLRPAPGARLPDTLAGVARAVAGAPGAPPLRVAEVCVAGAPIFRADCSD